MKKQIFMPASKLKKILLFPAFFLINLLANAQCTFAQHASESFNVGTYLTATSQEQVASSANAGKPVAAILIVRLINFLSLLIGSCAFLAIVIGGIMLLTSGGQEQQLTKGKDIIKYAIIGLVVALAAYFITAFVQSIFYEYGTTGAPATP